jgi:hypothetical protein
MYITPTSSPLFDVTFYGWGCWDQILGIMKLDVQDDNVIEIKRKETYRKVKDFGHSPMHEDTGVGLWELRKTDYPK